MGHRGVRSHGLPYTSPWLAHPRGHVQYGPGYFHVHGCRSRDICLRCLSIFPKLGFVRVVSDMEHRVEWSQGSVLPGLFGIWHKGLQWKGECVLVGRGHQTLEFDAGVVSGCVWVFILRLESGRLISNREEEG
jgi:hypothetical protein